MIEPCGSVSPTVPACCLVRCWFRRRIAVAPRDGRVPLACIGVDRLPPSARSEQSSRSERSTALTTLTASDGDGRICIQPDQDSDWFRHALINKTTKAAQDGQLQADNSHVRQISQIHYTRDTVVLNMHSLDIDGALSVVHRGHVSLKSPKSIGVRKINNVESKDEVVEPAKLSVFAPNSRIPPSLARSIYSTKATYRQVGRSGLRVSNPILGTLGFGDSTWMPWCMDEARVSGCRIMFGQCS